MKVVINQTAAASPIGFKSAVDKNIIYLPNMKALNAASPFPLDT
jgi:hypothetical protein